MSAASTLGPSALSRILGGSTVATLALVLVAVLVVFGLLIGERLFSVGTLQSMAFQLPELGILSLAMMITLLSGGLNLAIIATANLCGLAMGYILTTFVPGADPTMYWPWRR
jgi:simple sugar transport system permease protein